MVSGFLISPYDQDRIFSGLAIEIRIWSKTCAGTCGLKRFITSWFIAVSWARGASFAAPRSVDHLCGRGGVPPRHMCLLGGLGLAAAGTLFRVVQVDIETERTHLLDQHIEGFRNAGFERVVSAHDRLVHLGTSRD